MKSQLSINWEKTLELTSQLANHIPQSYGRKFDFKKNDIINSRFLVIDSTRGGMSDIYFCFDFDLQDMCTRVLKTISNFNLFDNDKKELIENETKVWIGLGHHPNIVRCDMFLPIYEKPYILLEWVAGVDGAPVELSNWLYHAKPDLNKVIQIAEGIVNGMTYANEASPGIVHRDLKPGNILIDYNLNPRITDFGLANVFAQTTGNNLNSYNGIPAIINNQLSTIIGTPLYMAPEQWTGMELDQRTDIYSFGCVLYEMLSRRLLFSGPMAELRHKHLQVTPSNLPDDIPPLIKDLTYKCLEKDPRQRFQSFAELQNAFIKILKNGSSNEAKTEYDAFYWGNRALTATNLEEYDKAQLYFNKAFKLDPNLTRAYNNRGIMFWKMKRFDGAIKDFSKAIKLDVSFGEAFANRGSLFLEIGKLDNALLDLNQAIKLDPNIYGAQINRARLHLLRKEFEEGLKDCEKANELSGNKSHHCLFIKSELLFGLKKYQESLNVLTQIEVASSDPLIQAKVVFKKIKPLSKLNINQAFEVGLSHMKTLSESFGIPLANPAIQIGDVFLEAESYEAALAFYNIAKEEGHEKGEELVKTCIDKLVQLKLKKG